ncbi:MAG: hypothetical protein R3Y36_05695 [Spirochaetales bacterium]
MNITKILEEIESEVVDLTVIWHLKKIKQFQELEYNINTILDESLHEVLEVFKSQDIDIQQKQILIYALQSAEFTKYKIFLNDLSFLYVEGYVEEFIMQHCIIPFNWSYRIRENYRDKDLQIIFQRCLDYSCISPSFEKELTEIKRGTTWRKFVWNKFWYPEHY